MHYSFFPPAQSCNKYTAAMKGKVKRGNNESPRENGACTFTILYIYRFLYKLPLVPYTVIPLRGHVNTQGADLHSPLCFSTHTQAHTHTELDADHL